MFIVNIKENKIHKKISNFSYHKGEKLSNCICNLNPSKLFSYLDFSRNTYILFGKTSAFITMEINIDKIGSKKIDSTEAKNLITHTTDLDFLNLPKISDNSFKLYTGKIVNHTQDYLVLGTNKGVVILKYNQEIRPNLVSCNKLIALTDSMLYFYKVENNSLIQIQNSLKLTQTKVKKL